jgi:hypothetical protein
VNSKWAMMAGCLALVFMEGTSAQSASNSAAAPEATQVAPTSPVPDAKVLRELDDPATGNLWLVMRDPNHPAGPGRLVLAERRTDCEETHCVPKQPVPELPIIHTGDAVTVEEHTIVLDIRLQAVALEPSLQGASFKARLKIGGKVARVMAIAPGHAVFLPESEVKP